MHQITFGETLKNKKTKVDKFNCKQFLNENQALYSSIKDKNVMHKNGNFTKETGINYISTSVNKDLNSHFKAILRKEYYECEKKFPFLGEIFLDSLLLNKNFKNLKRFPVKKNNIKTLLKKEKNLLVKNIVETYINNCSLEYTISLEKSFLEKTVIEKSNDITFKNVFDKDYFSRNKKNVFYDYEVLVIDGYIETVGEIHHLLQMSSDDKDRTYVIFCYGISNDVKNTIIVNNKRKKIRVFPISFKVNEENLNILNDIAILHNDDVISSNKGETIYKAVRGSLKKGKKISIDINNLFFTIEPVCNRNVIKDHVSFLNDRYMSSKSEVNSSIIAKRIKSFSDKNVNLYIPKNHYENYDFTRMIDYYFKLFSFSNLNFSRINDKLMPNSHIIFACKKAKSVKNIFKNIEYLIEEVQWMPGIKHLIECHCYLNIFKNNSKIIYHKFAAFSKFDQYSKLIEKYVKCNNCEAVHRVYDIGRSEIFPGKDQTESLNSKEDISFSLPEKLVGILEKYNNDVCDYEHALDIIEEQAWGSIIVLKRDIISEMHQVKYLVIKGKDYFEIKNDIINDTIIIKWGNKLWVK